LKYNQTGPDSTGKTGFAPALQNRGQVTQHPPANKIVLDCGGKHSATPLSDHPRSPPTMARPGKSGVAAPLCPRSPRSRPFCATPSCQ
jgi:hypothetical protein